MPILSNWPIRSLSSPAARRLQEAGFIDCDCGHIQLLDVEAPSDVACECFVAINALLRRVVGWSPDGH